MKREAILDGDALTIRVRGPYGWAEAQGTKEQYQMLRELATARAAIGEVSTSR